METKPNCQNQGQNIGAITEKANKITLIEDDPTEIRLHGQNLKIFLIKPLY
jgi:hypothetical protein